MNSLVKKEIRLLLPGWLVALGLAFSACLIADHQSSASSFRTYILVFLPFGLAPVMVVMLALGTFGRELSAGTFSNLLAQPISRSRVWWTKTLLLAAVIFSTWAMWWFAVSTNSQLVMNGQQRFEVLTATFLAALAIYSGGLWTVLLLRQVAAAFWLTLLIPAFLAGLTTYLTGKYGSEEAILRNIVVVIDLYSLAGFFWARRMFLRAEDVAWTGGNISLPRWLKLPGRAVTVGTLRGRHPRLTLAAKEFHLHQSTFVVAGVLAVLHVCILLARKLGGGFNASPVLATLAEVFWVFWPVLPLMIGCVAVAEERKLGTLESQLCLPVRRRTQFVIKFGVALALAILFGVLMPAVFEGRRVLPDIRLDLGAGNNTPFSQWMGSKPLLLGLLKAIEPLFPFLPLSLFAIIFVSAAFYASTLARNTLQAIAPAIVGMMVMWIGLIGARFIEELLHYPLWRGGLIYFIGVPVLTITLGMLAFWNFKHVLVGWPVWRRNLSVLVVALVAVMGLTTAVYQRAWEMLGRLEPKHGPARLANAQQIRLHNFFNQRISALLPDGRAWSGQLVYYKHDFLQEITSGLISHAPMEASRFLDKTNWMDVTYTGFDVAALQNDGTLWVSATSMPGGITWDSHQTPLAEPAKLVRYGNDADWKSIAGRWMDVIALKTNGSLWRIGTSRPTGKKQWPGLRGFVPLQIGTNSNWTELFSINDRLVLRNADGHDYVSPAYVAEKGLLKLDDELTLGRVDYLKMNQWQSLLWTSSRRGGSFQVGVGADGRFYFVTSLTNDGVHGLKLGRENKQISHDTNWVAAAGGAGMPVALKADGTLWVWDFDHPSADPAFARATRLGESADWCAVAEAANGVIAMAADGSIWLWQLPNRYVSQDLWPFLRPTRRPQLLGNIFAQAE